MTQTGPGAGAGGGRWGEAPILLGGRSDGKESSKLQAAVLCAEHPPAGVKNQATSIETLSGGGGVTARQLLRPAETPALITLPVAGTAS